MSILRRIACVRAAHIFMWLDISVYAYDMKSMLDHFNSIYTRNTNIVYSITVSVDVVPLAEMIHDVIIHAKVFVPVSCSPLATWNM